MTKSEPFSAYRAAPGLNWSVLKHMDPEIGGCPAKAHAVLNEPDSPDTAAQRWGHLYHSLILEPETFGSMVQVLDEDTQSEILEEAQLAGSKAKKFSRSLGAYKDWAQSVTKSGKEIITPEELQILQDMYSALIADPEVRDHLNSIQKREMSVYFDHPNAPEVACKARIDAWFPDAIMDLKTTASAHPVDFARHVVKYQYDKQLAFYSDGLKAVGMPVRYHYLLAQEKQPPYLHALHMIGPDWMEHARKEVDLLIHRWGDCAKSGKFPGYGNGELLPPLWMESIIEANS